MRRYLFVLCLVIVTNSLGQDIKWNSAPSTGFVFQITNDEAEELLGKTQRRSIMNRLLYNRIDTFNVVQGWINRPGKGHFILVKIVENKLHCEYTSVVPYRVLLLKEYNALSLQVLDLDGNVRHDATVKFRTRRIRFDHDSKTHRIENTWVNAPEKVVTVDLGGFRSVLNIEKRNAPNWSQNYDESDGPDFYSYMITDKNRYRPGERVRFKSYALTGFRSPVRKDLEVWLMQITKPSVMVATVSPHRPGSFASEFHLHDSLKLMLNTRCILQLREKSGRIVSNCNFIYEDYEVHGNRLEVEVTSGKQFHPAPNALQIKAINENGLLLKDVSATVTIRPDNIRETFEPLVILADTVMVKDIQLDANGPTNLEIPSGIFKKTNTTYHIDVSVRTTENQRMESRLCATHYYSQVELNYVYSNDSILYFMTENGVPVPGVSASLQRDHETSSERVMLPYKERLNPTTATVRLETNGVSRIFEFVNMLPRIELQGGIVADSFKVFVINPQRIPVSWYVYHGSELVQKGFGTDIDYKTKIEDRNRSYYVEILYSFGGTAHVQSREYVFREGMLDISLNLPDRVYPGQTVDALIEVTDDLGNPVKGVDLTAIATTSKLNYVLPDLPYFRDTSSPRMEGATFRSHQLSRRSEILSLDYGKWVTIARLDTMKFYQFAYPGKEMFVHELLIKDSTQFAVYVMKNGSALDPYVIEVNRIPVYYSWTDQPKAFSFYVEPERNKEITIRLHDRVIILDSLRFKRGKKTILSIDVDNLSDAVRVVKMNRVIGRRRLLQRTWSKWEFTATERSRHRQYVGRFQGTSTASYLEGNGHAIPISRGGNGAHHTLVGPIQPGRYQYVEVDRQAIRYKHNGGFEYAFEENVVYRSPTEKLIPEYLVDHFFHAKSTLNDVAINKRALLDQHKKIQPWLPRIIELADYASRLKIFLPFDSREIGVASVLFRDCKTGQLMSPCKGSFNRSDYFTLPRGCQDVIVLFNDGTYLQMDHVPVDSYFKIVVNMSALPIHPADSSSRYWLKNNIKESCYTGVASINARVLNLTRSLHVSGNVQGTIFDESNLPMPGVTISVKGSTTGTATDVDGKFGLDIPGTPATLIVSFIGYVTKEIDVESGSNILLTMEPDIQQLQEIVVIGYGEMSRKNLTASVSVLSGKLPGVTITYNESDTVDRNAMDGEALSREENAERKLYQELLNIKTLRSQFSDVAIWEPRLVTDRFGQCKFSTTFPDDITRWDVVVYGMNSHLQTGTFRKAIRSYKPIMAELHVPRFLTLGDSVDLIGKVVNYSTENNIAGRTQWQGTVNKNSTVNFDEHHSERARVTPSTIDTLVIEYSYTRNDGYVDGERREVNIVPQGVVRANGNVTIVNDHKELRFRSEANETINLSVFDVPLNLYTEDVRYLISYRYDCNEQLASKLIGLINYKNIMLFRQKTFNYERDVEKIIKRLLQNQNEEFLWSWWNVSENTSYWMSAHILRALKMAEDAGYVVDLDVGNIARKATYRWEFLNQMSINDVYLLQALAWWGVKVDYPKYVKGLERIIAQSDSLSRMRAKNDRYFSEESYLNEKFTLLEIRQLMNLPFVRDSLLRYQKKTILDELYFTDGTTSHWHKRDLLTNAIAYRIISRDSALHDLKPAMQLYFLSSKTTRSWNTYEASTVLQTLLPDMIQSGATAKAQTTIAVETKLITSDINTFPFHVRLKHGDSAAIKKISGAPVYLMQYKEEVVTRQHISPDAFKIKRSFGSPVWQAGTPSILTVEMEVVRDALQHVMIEIPIPAGCSYSDVQPHNRVETHRESYEDRTVIFCENLAKGKYIFQVGLLPRFAGNFHVNPAKVSLMYFPVVSSNTDLSRVTIIEQQ